MRPIQDLKILVMITEFHHYSFDLLTVFEVCFLYLFSEYFFFIRVQSVSQTIEDFSSNVVKHLSSINNNNLRWEKIAN